MIYSMKALYSIANVQDSGSRGQSCHFFSLSLRERERGLIIRIPHRDVPTLARAACDWQNSFTAREQCLPNVLWANPLNPLYSLTPVRVSFGRGLTPGLGGSTSSPGAMG